MKNLQNLEENGILITKENYSLGNGITTNANIYKIGDDFFRHVSATWLKSAKVYKVEEVLEIEYYRSIDVSSK
jgi:hypothetical protein